MIRITRGSTGNDKSRAYKIFIDGVYCGKIKRNRTKEFEVENGRHIVSARSGWHYGSNSLHVYVNDSVIDLELRNALRGWNLWLFPGAMRDGSFEKDRYLFLREVNPNPLTPTK